VNIKENGDILILKMLGNYYIIQKRRIRPDCKVTEIWQFSVTKLIWGILIISQEAFN
jgi:hypothetical protein